MVNQPEASKAKHLTKKDDRIPPPLSRPWSHLFHLIELQKHFIAEKYTLLSSNCLNFQS